MPKSRPGDTEVGARPASRRRWLTVTAIVALVAVGSVAAVVSVMQGRGSRTSTVRSIAWDRVPHLQTGKPPWTSEPQFLPQRLGPSGLDALSTEGAVLHIHQHLDV